MNSRRRFYLGDDPCRFLGGKYQGKKNTKPVSLDMQPKRQARRSAGKRWSYKRRKIREFMQDRSQDKSIIMDNALVYNGLGGIKFV